MNNINIKELPDNHCIFCNHWLLNINEQPCSDCLHLGEVPGRDRSLFTKRGAKKQEIKIIKPTIKSNNIKRTHKKLFN